MFKEYVAVARVKIHVPKLEDFEKASELDQTVMLKSLADSLSTAQRLEWIASDEHPPIRASSAMDSPEIFDLVDGAILHVEKIGKDETGHPVLMARVHRSFATPSDNSVSHEEMLRLRIPLNELLGHQLEEIIAP